uniref:SAP domain-containing protein n=1 Tax=uncultured bacterium contig00027 TaxID=1181516 RepID=A0A806KFQ3_9BACT|nr:hypothetical protein [uncultured bacterium contig00027]
MRVFLLLCLFSLFISTLPAQENSNERKTSDAEIQRIELEIKSSSLPELAVWCRSLGLSEGGTRADLAQRLRAHFNMAEPGDESTSNQIPLDIKSAQSAEYFRIEITDEDYARLKGGVSITLKDSDAEHNVKADEILFNRSRNLITARGNVEYTRLKGESTEIFKGDNINVNIDNWSAVFLDGDFEKKLENDNTAYRFEGMVITRNEDDVMVLNDARISNANNEEALWSISASRLWLLPGSDFAVFNAVLNVGEIPLLYIPFFYFPVDEIVFHPVLGYRSREGAFIQTTFYILGRPRANTAEQSSLTRILGNSNDMEKRQHGLFLRSIGTKSKDPNDTTLKAMVDYYTNTGFYLGIDYAMPKKGILNPLDLTFGLGFTRTISLINGNYNPYAPMFDGTFDWNKSNLFSLSVPFRYRLRTQSSISGKYGQLSWNIPFYSDPYVDRDFLNRSENMDWVNMVQQGAAADEAAWAQQELGAYNWNINGRITPQIKNLSPYITNLSFSTISTTLAFKGITDDEIAAANRTNNSENPAMIFFAPDKFTIYNISASISGTPLSLGGAAGGSTAAEKTEYPEFEETFQGLGTPRSPWQADDNTSEKVKTDDQLIPPVLNQRFDLPRAGNLRFSIDYQLSPASSTELQFMSGYGRWKSYDMVKWDEVQSVLSNLSGNGNISMRMDHSSGLFSNAVTLSGTGTLREYSYLNEEAEAYRTPQRPDGNKDPDRITEARRQQYGQTNYSSSYSYNGSLRPFYNYPVFSSTNLQYTLSGILVRSKKYIDGDSPELTPQWGTWAKTETKDGEDIYGLSSHRLTASFGADIINNQQNFSLSADLPPLDGLISANATLRAWISETNARIEFKNPEIIDNEPNNEWKPAPFYLTETLKFNRIGQLSFSMIMDPEKDNSITSITSSLQLWDFRASFNAVELRKSEFVPDNPNYPSLGGKWTLLAEEEPVLNPRDLTLSYSHTFPARDIVRNRLNYSLYLNTRLFFDLQRYTSSNFEFRFGFTLGINNFLDFNIAVVSQNNIIFRYFKNVPGMEDLTFMYSDGPQNNIFIDLFDSFSFWDESKRRRSGFKMNNFSLKATHYMGDWKAILDISMSPYLNNTLSPPRYELNTAVSFLVQWSAITEIKSDINYEKKTDRWSIK